MRKPGRAIIRAGGDRNTVLRCQINGVEAARHNLLRLTCRVFWDTTGGTKLGHAIEWRECWHQNLAPSDHALCSLLIQEVSMLYCVHARVNSVEYPLYPFGVGSHLTPGFMRLFHGGAHLLDSAPPSLALLLLCRLLQS